ncbi:hypothetical protein IFR05_017470, partial [Cadophora sp. M221]
RRIPHLRRLHGTDPRAHRRKSSRAPNSHGRSLGQPDELRALARPRRHHPNRPIQRPTRDNRLLGTRQTDGSEFRTLRYGHAHPCDSGRGQLFEGSEDCCCFLLPKSSGGREWKGGEEDVGCGGGL